MKLSHALSASLSLAVSLVLSASALAASPGALSTDTLSLRLGLLKLRIATQSPASGPVLGDILYFHGFADRLDNHGPLFDEWNRAGFRVVSFDLPSHGETSGIANNIDKYGFEDLAQMALQAEQATRESAERPLILAGWSTGGLLATRMAQTEAFAGSGRAISGMILFAPGIAVRPLVGDHGIVTQATLTNNPSPPHRGPISPRSPLLHPIFASKLLANAMLAQHEALPASFPTLVLLADDDQDLYVKSPEVLAWARDQRDSSDAALQGAQCAGAKHELDNEPSPVGDDVRAMASAFALSVVMRSPVRLGTASCPAF